MRKTKIFGALITLLACIGLASCGETPTTGEITTEEAPTFKIGILQPVEHAALGAARLGFIDKLEELGIKVDINYQNANGVEADLNTLAKNLVGSSDLTLGIGTGASQSLQAAALNLGSDKPILFTAVTDAIEAHLVESNEHPGGHITGTSDRNPVAAQIDLIKECLPDATKIGILYTASEINSEVQANEARAEAEAQGLQVEIATCTDSSDINSVVNNLCGTKNIDALYIPTDNNVAANMTPVKNALENYHILGVAGEEGLLIGGAHVTLSVSYTELGKLTGVMAKEILVDGKSPADIPVKQMSKEDCAYVMSSANLAAAGITLPEEVLAKFTDIND